MAKYTYEAFKPCDKYGKCPHKNGCLLESHPGYYEGDNGLWVKCHFLVEHMKKEALKNYIYSHGLLSKRNYTFVNYVGNTSRNNVKAIMDIAFNPNDYLGTNYYIYGPNGTQKTTILKAMGRQIAETFIQEHKDVLFTTMSSLVNELSKEEESKFRNDDYFDNYQLELMRRAEILILDESFDADKMKAYKSRWNLDLLDNFIRKRMDDEDKSTFYISNISPQLIDGDLFGTSIRDLIDRDTESMMFLDRYDSVPTRQL